MSDTASQVMTHLAEIILANDEGLYAPILKSAKAWYRSWGHDTSPGPTMAAVGLEAELKDAYQLQLAILRANGVLNPVLQELLEQAVGHVDWLAIAERFIDTAKAEVDSARAAAEVEA